MLVAHLARYAHQPLSEIFHLSYEDARALAEAVSDLIRQENTPQGG